MTAIKIKGREYETKNTIRTVDLYPYPKADPWYTLELFGIGTPCFGEQRVAYRLSQSVGGRSAVLFEDDYFFVDRPADSDEAVKCVMHFLTLRGNEINVHFFDDYTPEQRIFRDRHAEAFRRFLADWPNDE